MLADGLNGSAFACAWIKDLMSLTLAFQVS
jgi:hypothetical protein